MIRLKDLSVRLAGFSLKDISLRVGQGEFFALLGPTGAGKTVLLEAVVGLVPLHRGRIWVNGRLVSGLPPERRGVGIVYQDCALFPHLSVRENITYGLRYHDASRPRADERFARLVAQLGIGHILERSPLNLSGGERQRVALARALIIEPAVVLLDEPLSALDPNFREEIQIMLKEIHRDSGLTFLMVSHDFAEVLYLADRAAVMNRGALEQTGSVGEIFRRPASAFVARFVGMKNVFEALFDGRQALIGGLKLILPAEPGPGQRFVAVRPEDIALSPGPPPEAGPNVFSGRLIRLVDQGPLCEVHVAGEGVLFKVLAAKGALSAARLTPEDEVFVSVPPEAIHSL